MTTAIDWYANANQGHRVDFGIILSQVALERLAYEHCVRDRHLKSKGKFNKLPAAAKIRMMLGDLRIPTAIPSAWECANLAARKSWRDGPHALTRIRNELAHPDDRAQPGVPEACFVEGWKLATWYLEMPILALCGYRGAYWNRMAPRKELEEFP